MFLGMCPTTSARAKAWRKLCLSRLQGSNMLIWLLHTIQNMAVRLTCPCKNYYRKIWMYNVISNFSTGTETEHIKLTNTAQKTINFQRTLITIEE